MLARIRVSVPDRPGSLGGSRRRSGGPAPTCAASEPPSRRWSGCRSRGLRCPPRRFPVTPSWSSSRADWSALVAFGPDGAATDVLLVSSGCPGFDENALRAPLRLSTPAIVRPGEDPVSGTALVPLLPHPLGLVLVRVEGPSFHRSELWRLAEVGKVAGGLLTSSGEDVHTGRALTRR